MKNELKTLKDMVYVWVTDNPKTGEGHYQKSPVGIFCKEEELRQEAIKWIKSYKEEIDGYDKQKKGNNDWGDKELNKFAGILESKISFIKHFFNIEESELK